MTAPLHYETPAAPAFDPAAVTRPDKLLMRYYFIVTAFAGPLYPLIILPLYIRYKTLHYRFDDEGVSMRWGWLFRKETYLTYRRIQDIHVTRNLVHRWLGLSEVAIQTAAGSTQAEMKIEGIRDPEGLRDFLYLKMRGIREHGEHTTSTASAASSASAVSVGTSASASSSSAASSDELLSLLTDIRDELRKRNDRNTSDGGNASSGRVL